jgi:hypothetical protein
MMDDVASVSDPAFSQGTESSSSTERPVMSTLPVGSRMATWSQGLTLV